MKSAAVVLALLTLLPASTSLARERDSGPTVHSSCCDPPARWAARHDPRDARIAITTEKGDGTLLLTGDVAALQLSNRAFNQIRRKLKNEQDNDDDNVFAHAIKTAVLSGVRAMLDHSAECPIRHLEDVEYRNGRLLFTTDGGEHIFDDMSINDREVMGDFSERDARAFVREFRRIKARDR